MIKIHMFTVCFLVLFCLIPQYQSKILQIFQIARHGARTPSSFEYKPQQYTEKTGELTILGRVQHYFLGLEMRKRYVEDLKIIPETFDPSKLIIKASGKTRVVSSAFAFVNGLYPQDNGVIYENIYAKNFLLENLLPLKLKFHQLSDTDIHGVRINEEWAKEVVNVIPADEDLFFHADQGDNCPVAKQRIKEIKHSARTLELEEEFRKTVYPQVVEVINTAVGHERLLLEELNIQTVKRILDSHRCNHFHGVEPPPFDDATLKHLENLRYNFIYQILYKDEMVQAISATKLLEDIHNYIIALMEKRESPKYIFYAAHDHNIEAFLAILLDPESLKDRKYFMVEFASIFAIEVHEEEETGPYIQENIGDGYYLRFLYNDEPLRPRWCGGEKCSWQKFKEIVQHFVIPNIEEICRKKNSNDIEL